MRIGIDYWPATTHGPGVGRYTRELVRALARCADTPDLALFDFGPGPRGVPSQALGLERAPRGWSRLTADFPRGVLGGLAVLGLGADRLLGGCDLFHQVRAGEPPLGRLPRVLALAELPLARGAARSRLERAFEGDPELVVFSNAARIALVEIFGRDPARVHALPVGCEHFMRDVAPRDDLEGPARVVALGRSDTARGALVLWRACERLLAEGRELELVWCGRPGDAAAQLRAARADSRWSARLHLWEEPREEDLPALLAGACVLVHVNSQEWTPVTPLEGLAAGAAVLVNRLPAFEEALGTAVHWAPASTGEQDAAVLAVELERALTSGCDPAARRERRRYAEPFTWDRNAALTADLWRRILGRR
jgi:glycosyltransferase involved in cell wall biosynthesis